jgi:hypothetical protein
MSEVPVLTKIHIDLQRGVVEAEGDPAFVKEVYEDFKAQVLQAKKKAGAPQPANDASAKAIKSSGKGGGKAKVKGKAAASAKNGKLDKSLDLYGGDGVPSLKDYLAGFEPKNNKHKNVVFISYLKDELSLEPINIDHIFTCYHTVDKLPKALQQSLYDTSAEGYINFSADDTDITLAVKGMNWLKDNVKKPDTEAS